VLQILEAPRYAPKKSVERQPEISTHSAIAKGLFATVQKVVSELDRQNRV
jgi:hypothetical protein